jgi:hypothetical protein
MTNSSYFLPGLLTGHGNAISGRVVSGAISESVARPALAKHLIALAKEGVVSLDALAEGGYLHLVSITPAAQHWGHLRIEGAGARFQREWRVRKSIA